MDLKDNGLRSVIRFRLELQTNDKIDLKLLKAYLEAEDKYGDIKSDLDYQALKLKYDSLTKAPTIIEKTMSPYQLYASNSPFWTHDYTADKVRRILVQLEDKPRTEENFNKAIKFVTDGPMMFDEFGNIGTGK